MEIICVYIFINRRRYSEKDTRQNRTGSAPFGYSEARGLSPLAEYAPRGALAHTM